jgi:Protein of unknown function (DUF3341)
MSAALLAAFAAPGPLLAAAHRVRQRGLSPLDAFTPYPIEGLAEALQQPPTRVPWWMLGGGLVVAALFYAMEWVGATRLYPFNQGARPLHSWPAFLVATVEISVLAAALTGFVVMLVKAGLPRLHHPLFASTAFERASQDQFLLAVALPANKAIAVQAREALFEAGAVWVEEVTL